jgi:hypothetical protein
MLAAVTGSLFSCCGLKPKEDVERFCGHEFRPERQNDIRRGVGEENFHLDAVPTVEQRRQRRVSIEGDPPAPVRGEVGAGGGGRGGGGGGGWGTGWLPKLPGMDDQAGAAWLQNIPGLTPRAEKAVSSEARGQGREAPAEQQV